MTRPMMRAPLLTIVALLALALPARAGAARTASPASFKAAQSLIAASSSPGNAYAAGASVVVTAPVAGDLSVLGGSVITAAPVAGDSLILAGSVRSRADVAGDLRCLGGAIDVGKPVGGDLIAVGMSVHDSGRAGGSVFIVARNATLDGGASGPVTVYGDNVFLAGNFAEDVTVVAGSRVALAPGTTIRGKFSYEAPDVAAIPSSAKITGGVAYTNASYLPDIGTSRALAFMSIGFFMVARVIGAIILAGLLAGLFPRFAEMLGADLAGSRPRDLFLAALLGFAILVATPVVVALLLLTFVGIGLAFLLAVSYALLAVLAVAYAGILCGGVLARKLLRRERVSWQEGAAGMAVVALVSLVPAVGFPAAALAAIFAGGVLLRSFYRFAFPA